MAEPPYHGHHPSCQGHAAFDEPDGVAWDQSNLRVYVANFGSTLDAGQVYEIAGSSGLSLLKVSIPRMMPRRTASPVTRRTANVRNRLGRRFGLCALPNDDRCSRRKEDLPGESLALLTMTRTRVHEDEIVARPRRCPCLRPPAPRRVSTSRQGNI